MDLIKIGKFISSKRKEKNITQSELAEKLYITDRAISKWENGVCLPDAGTMPLLCEILGITINDLFSGEKVDMKDNEKKLEENLLAMARLEEAKNKRLIADMWILTLTTAIFYIGIVLLACSTLEEGPILGTIIAVSTVVLVAVCFYGLKLEVDAGYYECKNCHHRFTTTYFKVLMAPHMSTTRYLKCPKCNKRSWSKKVMTKE